MGKIREIEFCNDMSDVRRNIDRLDEEIVMLLAERAGYVAQAARIKSNPETVRIPERIEEVIDNVKRLAHEYRVEPAIIEAAYRPMVEAYINFEMTEYQKKLLK